MERRDTDVPGTVGVSTRDDSETQPERKPDTAEIRFVEIERHLYVAKRKFYPLVALLIAVIVVLTGASVLFYKQLDDYRDAEYLAQHTFLSELSHWLGSSTSNMYGSSNANYLLELRLVKSIYSICSLEALDSLCDSLAALPSTGEDADMMMDCLAQAFTKVRGWMYSLKYQIEDTLFNGNPFIENESLRLAIADACPVLDDIGREVFSVNMEDELEATGFYDSPYSIADRLDTERLELDIEAIMAVDVS